MGAGFAKNVDARFGFAVQPFGSSVAPLMEVKA
jgi:hypothetical protein